MSDLRVMCARAMQQPMQRLCAEFGSATGHAVALSFGTVGALKARLAAGETADVVIASLPVIAELEQAGMIAAGSRAVLGRTSIGVAVRAGHHCARPVHERFGMQSSTRASFYLYTTPEEIDALVDGLGFVRKFFKVD